MLSPGKANVGIIPAHFFSEGNVGLVSRSGTLTYQIGNEIAQSGFGNSTIVGIGGDPIVGSSFIDIISLFEQDDETELIVMCGEIGGDEEERTADYIAEHVTKPVIAYIAGFTAPPGKTMGHAGAIVSGSKGTAQAKAEALEAKGVRVGRNPTQVAELAVEYCSAGIRARVMMQSSPPARVNRRARMKRLSPSRRSGRRRGALAAGQAVPPETKITRNGVGKLKLGMTAKEARELGLVGRKRPGCRSGGTDTRSARAQAPAQGHRQLHADQATHGSRHH